MTKKEIIQEIKYIIELEGDGGCSSYSSEEKQEMMSFLDNLIKPIDEDELDEKAHSYCMSNGYSGLNEEEYIPMGNTRWGDVMFDIEEAYKAGCKAMKE